MDPESYSLVDDISAASAAYLFNALSAIASLPASEAFERLKSHFEAALAAFIDGAARWCLPEPSEN